VQVPDWLLAVSPFHDVGLVPGEPFEAGAAAIMVGAAALLSVGALWAFRRRDLIGA
jgi:MYXO-CTERM domain-containing protein